MSRQERESLKEKTDEELISITLRGDNRAFDVLVLRHSRRITYTIQQMVRNEAAAYDIAQDAFIKAYRSLKNFNGDAAFYTWLYRIARNLALNWLRDQAKKGMESLDDGWDEGDDAIDYDKKIETEDSDSDTRDAVRRKEIVRSIKQAMQKLSFNHREVVTLCDICGYTYSEVSKMLSISEGTLRSRLHYAHKQLQVLLAELR